MAGLGLALVSTGLQQPLTGSGPDRAQCMAHWPGHLAVPGMFGAGSWTGVAARCGERKQKANRTLGNIYRGEGPGPREGLVSSWHWVSMGAGASREDFVGGETEPWMRPR